MLTSTVKYKHKLFDGKKFVTVNIQGLDRHLVFQPAKFSRPILVFPRRCHKGYDQIKLSYPQHIEMFKDMPQIESDTIEYAEEDQPFKI